MGLFKGKDDSRYAAWLSGGNRADAKGDHETADRQWANAKEVARDGDVSVTAKLWPGYTGNGGRR